MFAQLPAGDLFNQCTARRHLRITIGPVDMVSMDQAIECLVMRSPFGIDGSELASPDVLVPFGFWMDMSYRAPEGCAVPLPHKWMAATAATCDPVPAGRGRGRSRSRRPRRQRRPRRDDAGDRDREHSGGVIDLDPEFTRTIAPHILREHAPIGSIDTDGCFTAFNSGITVHGGRFGKNAVVKEVRETFHAADGDTPSRIFTTTTESQVVYDIDGRCDHVL
jgi:hypothetical protein